MGRTVALIGLVGLSPVLGGCLAAFHEVFHHSRTITRDESKEVRLRRVEASPMVGTEFVRAQLGEDAQGKPVVRASVVGFERQVWEWRGIREVDTLEVCDGQPPDTWLFAFTIGLPFLVAEYLVIIPAIFELAHEANHKTPRRDTRTKRTSDEGPPQRKEETVEVLLPGRQVQVEFIEQGGIIPLGSAQTSEMGHAEVRLFGACPRALKMGPFALRVSSEDSSGRRIEAPLEIPGGDAFIAALQGADWSADDSGGTGDLEAEALVRTNSNQDAVILELQVRNSGKRPLSRLTATLKSSCAELHGWFCRMGRLASENSDKRVFEVPVAPQRWPRNASVELEFSEERGHGSPIRRIPLLLPQGE